MPPADALSSGTPRRISHRDSHVLDSDPNPHAEDEDEGPGTVVPPPLRYQELDYLSPVDESLLCPICKTPFYRPVTTKACGHTFCAPCLRRAHALQPTCPIDRSPLRFPADACLTRVVADQVGRLRVRCPNAGCGAALPRDELAAHHERVCAWTQVACPDPACDRLVVRRDAVAEGAACLHRHTDCRYCGARTLLAELEGHYERDCKHNREPCDKCGADVVRHLLPRHAAETCAEEVVPCRYTRHGCRFRDKRGRVGEEHEADCVYRAIGRLSAGAEQDRRTIRDLQGEVASLRADLGRERALLRERTIPPAGLLRAAGMGSFLSDLDLDGTGSHAAGPRGLMMPTCVDSAGGASWESSDEYLLAQFERMVTNYEDLRKSQTEMDGRHAMLLLNETMPIKEQLAELRSNLGVIGMHTAWLMNMMRHNRGLQQQQQQQQHRPGAASAGGGNTGGTGTSGSNGSAAAVIVVTAGAGGSGGGLGGGSHARGEDEGGVHHHPFATSRRNSDGRIEPPPRL
ncbi:hypothetical protein P8C59_006924 [Phyllachora maydis]|uniref:Uncharacterized protein n=1 Tax=Phyllachora maydis TaxID=1825666 RepID=A0AAD9I919_9PEZI|nr:hypothetical protein P8C59_006924 [Phyllachora maydis]